MNILFTILVTFFAGMGAGLGTGFAGMSAAAVISPMLITFLHMDPYMAVGIALSSDVLASAVSAYTYHKNKNLDIKNGLIMMVSVLVFTVVGSWVASLLPSATMGSFSVFMTFLLGIKFIVRPVMTTKEAMQGVSHILDALEVRSFDDPSVPDVQTGDDAFRYHGLAPYFCTSATQRPRSSAPVYRLLPRMAAAVPISSSSSSSFSEEIPPLAVMATPGTSFASWR